MCDAAPPSNRPKHFLDRGALSESAGKIYCARPALTLSVVGERGGIGRRVRAGEAVGEGEPGGFGVGVSPAVRIVRVW